jgi:AcrR family transcriptional regulator
LAGIQGTTTKQAIIEVATDEFRRHGYRSSSLGDVASTLGITRAAVHFHVHKKAELLDAVLSPYLDAADALLAGYGPDEVLGPRQRRFLLGQLVDLVLAQPDVAAIVVGDVTWRSEDLLATRLARWVERFTALLIDGSPLAADRLVVTGILGAVVRSATSPGADPCDPATRDTIVRMATALARQLTRPTSG